MILEISLPININKTFYYSSQYPVEVGCRVLVSFNNRKITGYVINVHQSADIPVKEILKVIDPAPVINSEIIELSKWASRHYLCSLGMVLNSIISKSRILKSPHPEDIKNSPKDSVGAEPLDISVEQKAAVAKVTKALDDSRYKTFLLYGMNYSGKTEVYIRAIDWCIKNGKSAIYLVPDVFLTSQFGDLLKQKFGRMLGVWHSDLAQHKKNDILWRMKSGEIRIILGTRSAIFLPLAGSKLFILDEEDDDFYKNQQTPKYHARNVAISRAKISGGVVVLGSATPSIETYTMVKSGEIEILNLTERVMKSPVPAVTVVDMRFSGKFLISNRMRDAIEYAISRKKQVFLLVNRRGWFTVGKCGVCGIPIKCPKCAVPLVYHKKISKLVCHYCGLKSDGIDICPVCNGKVNYHGSGTERIEEIVKKIFPQTEVFRVDADTSTDYQKVFEIMKSGRTCILIGTQIVAKGFDFQDLVSVGVLNADIGLYSSDFRSGERTFSLLTHSIGRCGRSIIPGRIVIQTCFPEHYAVKSAAEFDYEKFYDYEIDFRREFMWPPFVSLVNITISGKNEKDTSDAAEHLANCLEVIENMHILGPAPKAIPYLSGKYRFQVLVKFAKPDMEKAKNRLLEIVANFPKKSGVRIIFDVDPSETT